MDEPAIRAHALVKRYGDTAALDGFDLEVPAGTVCGLLGPNGAGKTTAVRILTTLLRADGGRATVAGADVIGAPHAVRARIGLSGQEPAVDEILGPDRTCCSSAASSACHARRPGSAPTRCSS